MLGWRDGLTALIDPEIVVAVELVDEFVGAGVVVEGYYCLVELGSLVMGIEMALSGVVDVVFGGGLVCLAALRSLSCILAE